MQQSNPALQQNSNDNSEEHHIEEIVVCIDRPKSLNRILVDYIHYRNLESKEEGPLRDLLEHLPILLDKDHEDKGDLEDFQRNIHV